MYVCHAYTVIFSHIWLGLGALMLLAFRDLCGYEKPFAFDELLARVLALLRKHTPERCAVLAVEDLQLDTVSRTVTRGARTLSLTAKEYV